MENTMRWCVSMSLRNSSFAIAITLSSCLYARAGPSGCRKFRGWQFSPWRVSKKIGVDPGNKLDPVHLELQQTLVAGQEQVDTRRRGAGKVNRVRCRSPVFGPDSAELRARPQVKWQDSYPGTHDRLPHSRRLGL